MAPRSLPKEFIGKTGKFDHQNFDISKYERIPVPIRKQILKEALNDIRGYLRTGKFTEEVRESAQLISKIDEAYPEFNLKVYPLLVLGKYEGTSKRLTKDMIDQLKNDDPTTFRAFAENADWERYIPNGEGGSFDVRDMLSIKDGNVNIHNSNSVKEPSEPSAGVLTDKPLNNASPAEPGALTNLDAFEVGPKRLSYQSWDDAELNEILARGSKKGETNEKLSEASNQPALPNIGKTIKEAEANAYTGKEPPIADYNTPITPPGVHVSFNEKPVNLSSEEVTKFKPNSASPSPEVIHEAMADAVKKGTPKDGTVTVPPEAEAAAKAPAAGETPKAETETKTEATTGKTDPKALETPETPQGLFSRLGGHIGRNWGKYLLGGGLGTVGWGIINDLASENSKLRSSFTEGDYTLDANQPHVKSLDQREGAYMPERLLRFTTNEEYTPGKIPSHIPQDRLDDKELPDITENKSQSQVVNAPAPVNNATADYVRAAYNSYIPSDAGRAYQKAIYGDPLELERMRLQQQQQKWRDFVMRSGQSPAELVQRGLMPYDALQYV